MEKNGENMWRECQEKEVGLASDRKGIDRK